MDYSNSGNAIALKLNKEGVYLTEAHKLLLNESVSKLLEQAYRDGKIDQAKLEIQGREKFLADLRAEVGA